MIRNKILNFLQWNDRNGCFTDNNCILEGYEPFTFCQAVKIFVHVIAETENYEDTNATIEFSRNPKVKECLHLLLNGSDCVVTYRKAIDIL